MSLISLSSAKQNDNANFRNNFYKGLKIAPNSEVACVSAVMNYNRDLVIDESNDTFNIQVGDLDLFNGGFSYKVPHGIYSVAGLVSIINTNVLTTVNVSYLRGSKVSGGFSLNFTDTDVPADSTKGVNFTVDFTPLQTASKPTCKAIDWYEKPHTNTTVSFGSNADGTTITKSDTHGDNTKYDGVFCSENSLMENQHATFVLRKQNGETWDNNTDVALGVYGIFSTTDFENINNTQFIKENEMDDEYEAIKPLFGFIVGESADKSAVAIEQVETDYGDHPRVGRSLNAYEDVGGGARMVELNDANDVYYIRIWLGQEEATPSEDHDNNSAFYFITTSAPNDTFVSTAATWISWMKFGTRFYPLRVGGGIKQNDSTIAVEMCATDKNLSTGVLANLAKQFSPATWEPLNHYFISSMTSKGSYSDGTTTGGRPERKLTFSMSVSTQQDLTNDANNIDYPNFGNVLGFAQFISSSVLVATGNYSYNNTNFKTGTIDKPYTTAQPSTHIQITNLPIQSYNGVSSSVVRTIAVIPRQRYLGTQGSWTASQLVWVNINNAEELIMTELDVRITDNSNKVIENLEDDTEVLLMFRHCG
tara:strand:+ start:1179 stop:2951 length:1773 start_codon:yes stop_codon:yes gene_type:complete